MSPNQELNGTVPSIEIVCRCNVILTSQDVRRAVEEAYSYSADLGKSEHEGIVDWVPSFAHWLVFDLLSESEVQAQLSMPWPFVGDQINISQEARQRLRQQLDGLLSQMASYAALACEIAAEIPQFDDGLAKPFEFIQPARNGEYSTGQVLENLCRALLYGIEARNEYEYERLADVLYQCSDTIVGFGTRDFSVLQALKLIARAGRSRINNAVPRVKHWEDLASAMATLSNDICRTRSSRGEDGYRSGSDSIGHCCAYPQLILISAIGHMRRDHVAKHAAALGSDGAQFLAVVLDALGDLTRRYQREDDMSLNADAGGSGVHHFFDSEHHLEYYRYFTYHIIAMALERSDPSGDNAGDLKWLDIATLALKRSDVVVADGENSAWQAVVRDLESAASIPDVGQDDQMPMASIERLSIYLNSLNKIYSIAQNAIERALERIPNLNRRRAEYYELTAEVLENISSVRLALAEDRIMLVERLNAQASIAVDKAWQDGKQELERGLAEGRHELDRGFKDVTMRIVEIIGVFLAIVTIAGTSVFAATEAEWRLGDALWILLAGGFVVLAFMLFLRFLVFGSLGRQRKKQIANGKRS